MRHFVVQILLILFVAGPVSANEDILCVQEHLAMHGYNPGPIDGANGPKTTQMAVNFGIDFRIDLPRLSNANADQWCAALRLVARGAGGPILADQVLTDQRPHLLEVEARNTVTHFENARLQPQRVELTCAT